ncbi:Eukaryotic aspartyl protease family protein [Rhynchospora pubera]|uniref:Eukaryotic aspartyl protease family protein n=1 Tax=Rhynchospora pubera TaxID=906938 RepID=A0AAV8EAV3_9POAL|nr:Eukaryotic aspartyl protease family protein [Rhynchospora pubera]
MASLIYLSFQLLIFTATTFALVAGDTISLDFHHRFSYKVRQWAESQGIPATWHPSEAPEGSVEYYKELVRHDRALLTQHRQLITSTDVYNFAMGNETLSLPSLAYLYYAAVSVGTPNQTFLVAMDTGSDLFWLPCNCVECAPLKSPLYGDLEFSTYSTNASSTSKTISCGSSECSLLAKKDCTGTSTDCPYTINYLGANTSSSGFLVEDVLYLAKGDTGVDTVEIPVVFGCGEVQSGSLLEGSAPNGLMGLAMDNLSVPTVLANKGMISDSFSLCFGDDDSGRLNFGDIGSSDQSETPLVVDNNNSPYYSINLEGMAIGNTTFDTSFAAMVDSGASFTILEDQIYKEFTTAFAEQVTETQFSDPNLPFEYCYQLSAGQTEIIRPVVYFTTKGGSQFPALHPIVPILSKTTQEQIGYCIGVLQSTNINIIGQNFLRDLRVVFNREKMVLGWEQFDCYSGKSSTTPPTDNTHFAPSPAGHTPATHTPATQVPLTQTPVAQAPAPPQSEANQPHRLKSWAPELSPSTMSNTALCLFLLFFVNFFYSD